MPRRPAGRPSLATVAERLGVSTATVSNAFNRPDDGVGDAARAGARRGRATGLYRSGSGGPSAQPRPHRHPRPAVHRRAVVRVRRPCRGQLRRGTGPELPDGGAEPAADRRATPPTTGRPRSATPWSTGSWSIRSAPHDPHLRQILDRRLPTVVVDSPRDVAGVDWVGSDDRAGGRSIGRVPDRPRPPPDRRHRGRSARFADGRHRRRQLGRGAGRGASRAVARAAATRSARSAIDDLAGGVAAGRTPSAAGRVSGSRAARPPTRPDRRRRADRPHRAGCTGRRPRTRTAVPGRLTVTGYDDIPRAAAVGPDHGEPAAGGQGPHRRRAVPEPPARRGRTGGGCSRPTSRCAPPPPHRPDAGGVAWRKGHCVRGSIPWPGGSGGDRVRVPIAPAARRSSGTTLGSVAGQFVGRAGQSQGTLDGAGAVEDGRGDRGDAEGAFACDRA